MAAGQTQASSGAAGFGLTGDPATAATMYAGVITCAYEKQSNDFLYGSRILKKSINY